MEHTPHWNYHVTVKSSPYSSDLICKASALNIISTCIYICQDISTPTFSDCNFISTFHFPMHMAHNACPILDLDNTTKHNTMPWFRQLVAGLLPWRPLFNHWPVHVGSMFDTVALRQAFLRVLLAFPCHYHSINALTYSSITNAIQSQKLTMPINNMLKKQNKSHMKS
jgi:hypothetical protein